jgi:hypothetical protein
LTSTKWADRTNDIYDDKSFVLSVHFVASINLVFQLLEGPIIQRMTFVRMEIFVRLVFSFFNCSWTSFFCSCHIALFFSLDGCYF